VLNRFNVLNDPVNWIDPLGLKGGIIIPIRKSLKKNLTGDVATDVIGQALSIPTSASAVVLFDVLNPNEANNSENFYLFNLDLQNYPNLGDYNSLHQSTLDKISKLKDEEILESKYDHSSPCK